MVDLTVKKELFNAALTEAKGKKVRDRGISFLENAFLRNSTPVSRFEVNPKSGGASGLDHADHGDTPS